MMHFRHISAKIQPKNLKQHFDWRAGPPGYALVSLRCTLHNAHLREAARHSNTAILA